VPSANPTAQELPSGVFNDGQRYKLDDFKGKVLLLIYFSPRRKDWAVSVQQHVAWVKGFAGQPVSVLAVARGDTKGVRLQDAGVPVYVDNLQVFAELWGPVEEPSDCRIVYPDGHVGKWRMELREFQDAVKSAKWKYKDDAYDKSLAGVVELLEWNQYETGVKQLQAFRKDANKQKAQSAEKLYAAVKTEGESWKKQADGLAADKPVEAFDLYARLATVFSGEDLAAGVQEPLKTLKIGKAVADELAAREALEKVFAALPKATRAQIDPAIDALNQIVAKYPSTRGALRADGFVKALRDAQIWD
jgi:hypothetical protein